MRMVFLAVLLVGLLAAPVAAQENGTASVEVNVGSNGGNTTTPEPALEVIDNRTAIESAEFVDGEIRLVLVSDSLQRVVLTDAGAVLEGGEVPQKDARLREGRNRVSMPVTEFDGRVIVTIATRDVLYAVPIETSPPLIGGPFDEQDVQQAGLAGLAAGLGVTGLIAYRKVKGIARVPERVL